MRFPNKIFKIHGSRGRRIKHGGNGRMSRRKEDKIMRGKESRKERMEMED